MQESLTLLPGRLSSMFAFLQDGEYEYAPDEYPELPSELYPEEPEEVCHEEGRPQDHSATQGDSEHSPHPGQSQQQSYMDPPPAPAVAKPAQQWQQGQLLRVVALSVV